MIILTILYTLITSGTAEAAAVSIRRLRPSTGEQLIEQQDRILVNRESLSATEPESNNLGPNDGFSRAALALGTNIGQRAKNIAGALNQLAQLGTLEKTSFLYENPPSYKTDQPYFLNAATILKTNLKPAELLAKLQEIEDKNGRNRTVRYGPRTIDLDLLFYDSLIHNTSSLTIPHPSISERDFVLGPLLDICPDFIHPTEKLSITQLYRRLKSVKLAQVTPVFLPHLGTEVMINCARNEGTKIMAIINVTPDSFSEGNQNYLDVNNTIATAHNMVKHGAFILVITIA